MPRGRNVIEKPKNLSISAKKFLGSLKPWLLLIVIAIILAVGATVCSIFGPKILGQMTDSAVEDYQTAFIAAGGKMPSSEEIAQALNWGKLSGLAFTLIGLYLTSVVLNYIQGLILARISARYAQTTRAKIIDKISRLPISYFDRHKVGDTLSHISNDVGTITNTLSSMLSQVITSTTTLIGILVMMMTISIKLSLIALVAVPLSLLFISLVAKKAQTYFRKSQAEFGALNSVIEEDFSNQNIIKACSHEQASIDAFQKTTSRMCEFMWKANFLSALAFPITNVFTNLSYVIICVVGGRMAIDGALMLGGVQAFLQYVSQFNRPITEVSQIVSNIQQALAAAERIFNFLEEPEESPDVENALTIKEIKGAVEFHHVDFSYGKDPTIKDFSIKIEPGMQVAIVGPTGAGKTTIINLLMRFYDPDSGYISVDGVPTREMKRSDVRKMFGMVLQDTWLFSGTIEENLRYGRLNATHDDVLKATKMSNTHHFIESLSHGYKTEISEDSDNISAGEKQLLTIARAMVADPPMMILDEATSNVDTRTERIIQEAFTKLTHGRTAFVIAHRLSTIRDSDLILVMRDGSIVEQGKHEELLAQNGFYAELYNSQFSEDEG